MNPCKRKKTRLMPMPRQTDSDTHSDNEPGGSTGLNCSSANGPQIDPTAQQTIPFRTGSNSVPVQRRPSSRTTAWRMDKILAETAEEPGQFSIEVGDNLTDLNELDVEESFPFTARTTAWRQSKSLTAANCALESFNMPGSEVLLSCDMVSDSNQLQSDESETLYPVKLGGLNHRVPLGLSVDDDDGACSPDAQESHLDSYSTMESNMPGPEAIADDDDGTGLPDSQARLPFDSQLMAELNIPPCEMIADDDDGTGLPDSQARLPFDSQLMAELNIPPCEMMEEACFVEEDMQFFEEDSVDWAETEEVWYDSQDTQDNISQTNGGGEDAMTGEAAPLYEGCPINIGQSMLLILLFATRHTLTGAALSDLLTLISLHCLKPNLCRTSLFLFNKFFANLKSPVKFHRYCSFCMFLLDIEHSSCPVCQREVTEQGTSFFIEIPIAQQIVTLMQKNGFYRDVQHRFHRSKKQGANIEDIYDGEQYKHHMQPGGFLENKNNLSFMWYTDGCPIFKSSKYSLWPLYFLVNELPYKKRILKENMVYAGLWFGEKPAMGSFLMPFHLSLKQLRDTGVSVSVPGLHDQVVVKAMVLCGTCDLPARSMVMNTIQFNGAYGCCHCLQKGQSAQSGRGSTWTYPFNECNPKGPKRTHEGVMADAQNAYEDKRTVNGIKGPTFLCSTGCDLVNGMAIDYMHTVLLGVVRKLLHLWFDSSHHKEPFSIAKHVGEVDSRLISIKPPRSITRIPRSIKEHLCYWKASECRSWLFYYGVPVLSGILDDIYLGHFALLVEAVFILNGESITSGQLQYCERLFYHFCCTMGVLYGDRYMTAVVHQLVHLTDVVRQLGPLWVYSCFALEDANGSLLSFVRGTQKPELQILSSLQIMLRIPHLSNMVPEDSPIRGFVEHLTIRKHLPKKMAIINFNSKLIGTMKEYTPSSCVTDKIAEMLGYSPQRFWKFLRLQQGDHLFYSKEYTFTSKRNSYTAKYHHHGVTKYGEVQYYLKCVEGCTCTSTCLCSGKYVAYVANMEKFPICLVDDDVTHNRLSHISVVGLPDKKDIVYITHLVSVCVAMRFSEDRAFIAEMPNSLESD